MENDKKLSLQSILNNRRALIVISFLIALVVWLTISLNEAPEVERVVEHVKVTIDDSVPNQLGYEAFGASEIYVDVTVRGRRYLVGDNVLTADDIEVTAITTYVDSPGSYTLQLRATAKDTNASFTIVSKTLDYLEVYFDTPKTAEVAVEPNVVCEGDSLVYSDEYISENPIASLDKVTITGPATEVDKISRAVATVTTRGELRTTQTIPAELSIIDAYGAELKYLTVSETAEELTVTVPVYKLAELPVTVDFSGSPLYFIENPLTVVCSPTKISIAADETRLETLTAVSVGTVDFSTLLPGLNTLEFGTDDIKDAVPMEEEQRFVVYVNTGDVVEQSYTIDSQYINILPNNSGYTATLADSSLAVRLIGPQSVLSAISAGDVYAEIDLSAETLSAGRNTVPATIRIKDNRCWAYGKYTVNVTVTNSAA